MEARISLKGNLAFYEGSRRANTNWRGLSQASTAWIGLWRAGASSASWRSKDGCRRSNRTAHMVPMATGRMAVIEPWLTDQWYVDAKTLASRPCRRCGKGKPTSFQRIGRKPISNGLKTSSPGVFRGSFGGVTRYRLGMRPGAAFMSRKRGGGLCRSPGGRRAARTITREQADALKADPVRLAAMFPRDPTCSTLGFRPRFGRSPRSAGPSRQRN